MTGTRQLLLDASTRTIRAARSFACALFALAAAAPGARAQATPQAPTFALNWVRGPGAEGCIASGELARRIEQLLGPVFRTQDVADRSIEGLVTR
ncbi:MAG TPA: hypothetical protein VK509_06515, partial [Polyangiales bacterium]|nr:hypothetical protein [Polyangiales bacterium]